MVEFGWNEWVDWMRYQWIIRSTVGALKLTVRVFRCFHTFVLIGSVLM